MLIASALLYGYLWFPQHPRPRHRGLYRNQGGQPHSHRVAGLRRRRCAGNRRQPFHPRHTPQHRYQHHTVQQPDLWPDEGTVFPDLQVRSHHQDLSLRHRGASFQPRLTGAGRQGHLLRKVPGRGAQAQRGHYDRGRPARRLLRDGDAYQLRDFQRRSP